MVTEAGTSTTSGDDERSGITVAAAGAWPTSSFIETRVPVETWIDAGVSAASSFTIVTVAVSRTKFGPTGEYRFSTLTVNVSSASGTSSLTMGKCRTPCVAPGSNEQYAYVP